MKAIFKCLQTPLRWREQIPRWFNRSFSCETWNNKESRTLSLPKYKDRSSSACLSLKTLSEWLFNDSVRWALNTIFLCLGVVVYSIKMENKVFFPQRCCSYFSFTWDKWVLTDSMSCRLELHRVAVSTQFKFNSKIVYKSFKGPLPLPRPLVFQLAQQLISCPLALDKPFQVILCKSMNPLGSYASFSNRPHPLPCLLLANSHKHKHTPSHTHTWPPCHISAS